MLLNQAIATQQSLYSEIQSQIDALQEKQREIQAYLQRLGSVESKMESAALLLQEAVSEIQNTCPEELQQYQDLITGLFTAKPVAHLEASIEEPTQETAPETPTPGDSSVDSTIDSNPVITVTSKVVDENLPDTTTEPKEVANKPIEKDFSRLSWTSLQKFAARHGISPKGRKRSDVEKELNLLPIKQSTIDKAA